MTFKEFINSVNFWKCVSIWENCETTTQVCSFIYSFLQINEAASISYPESFYPLLLLDEFDPKVRLLDHVLSLELINHARLVHELTVTTHHLE